jgi:hypothetical protein
MAIMKQQYPGSHNHSILPLSILVVVNYGSMGRCVAGRWFSPGTPVPITNKTDRTV